LGWTNNSPTAKGILVQRSSDNWVTHTDIFAGDGQSWGYIDTDVVNGQTYKYRVFATVGVTDSDASNVATASPGITTYSYADDLSGKAQSDGQDVRFKVMATTPGRTT
jgi:hypothetical protein